jgi:glycosyltransferase involved in cell wall biosynthesis
MHCYLKHYPEIASLYHCLDVYLIASREEGGPKSVLESMASGVPLVTTRVGQAQDLVAHSRNGWMVESGDVEGLAHWVAHCVECRQDRQRAVDGGLTTARMNSYEAQLPLWKKFFDGFVA